MRATTSGCEIVYLLASMVNAQVLDWSPEFSLDGPDHASIVAERTSLTPERWWIHCVCNRAATVDDLATCLGVALLAKPNVVLFAATHSLSKEARQFASRVNSTTSTRIIALDPHDLDRFVSAPHDVPLQPDDLSVLIGKIM